MKCPNCGKWNRSGLPHCVYCGLDFETGGTNGRPVWEDELKVKKANAYLRVDEDGGIEATEDQRERLAREMADLKTRKQEGEEHKRTLLRDASRRKSSRQCNVHTTSNRTSFFSPYEERQQSNQAEEEERLRQDAEISSSEESFPQNDVVGRGDSAHILSNGFPETNEVLYDGYQDISAYYPEGTTEGEMSYSGPIPGQKRGKSRHTAGRRIFQTILYILLAIVLVIGGYKVYDLVFHQETEKKEAATVTATIRDDLAAHTITIPGEEGQRIVIRELRQSAIVIGGVATFDIADHVWYDNNDQNLSDSMVVTLTPYVVAESGKQQLLDTIQYEIEIPLSPISVTTPDSLYQVVSTTLFNIVFYVTPGSSVTINGDSYSDLIDSETGKVSYNATVQPIGNNEFEIISRSQYCRPNTVTVTLYRAEQSIPLDLASDISSTSSSGNGTMTIKGTTLPGAVIKVLSPYYDLDISTTDVDGAFSFEARFDKIGTNTVIITADYPGRETTRVEHNVYYVPNIDVYSRKAWDIVTQYTDLMDNLETRKNNSQIYVCIGTITSIDTTKPQRCFMNVGTDEEELIIYLENSTSTTWEVGKKYRVYADAYGMYSSKPWLIARYTYDAN